MNCTKCNRPVEDDALYCPYCKETLAVNEQKVMVSDAYANTRRVIVKQLKKPLFIVTAILFSIAFLAQLTTNLPAIVPFIFMLIALIGCWRCVATKNATVAAKALRQASIYDAYTNVMYLICIILLCCAAAGSFVMCLFAGEALTDMEILPEGLAGSASIIIALVFLIVFAICISIVSVFKGIFARRRAFFKGLAMAAETGNYVDIGAPVVGSIILGIFIVIGALPSIAMGISLDFIIDPLEDLLYELGDFGEFVEEILDTSTLGLALSGVGGIVNGAYYIVSGLWMSKVRKAELENSAIVAVECARLAELEEKTKAAIAADEEKKREAEEAERRARIDADKKAQEQKQQMMMQMMMQMMQANGLKKPETAEEMMIAKELLKEMGATPVQAPIVDEDANISVESIFADAVANTPAEEPAVEDAPVAEEESAEKLFADAFASAPVEEAPVEEAPVEEAPVEETPVEEAPVEEAPAAEAEESAEKLFADAFASAPTEEDPTV